jgi:carboxypeptidase C (cathepsin A)
VRRVEYLLGEGMPVLIYNGQDDLIVQSAGTMKWVDRISYGQIQEFR